VDCLPQVIATALYKILVLHLTWRFPPLCITYLALKFLSVYDRHAHIFDGIEGDYNLSLAANAKTVRDFDDGVTRGTYVASILWQKFAMSSYLLQYWPLFPEKDGLCWY
jgi:hypothetical protein